jgi:hypothetical protein
VATPRVVVLFGGTDRFGHVPAVSLTTGSLKYYTLRSNHSLMRQSILQQLVELFKHLLRHSNINHGRPFRAIGSCYIRIRIVPACNGYDDVDKLLSG